MRRGCALARPARYPREESNLPTNVRSVGANPLTGALHPMGDLNPRLLVENQASWASRRIGPEESGGIEPLGLQTTTPVFRTGCRPFSGALRLPAGPERFERPPRAL